MDTPRVWNRWEYYDNLMRKNTSVGPMRKPCFIKLIESIMRNIWEFVSGAKSIMIIWLSPLVFRSGLQNLLCNCTQYKGSRQRLKKSCVRSSESGREMRTVQGIGTTPCQKRCAVLKIQARSAHSTRDRDDALPKMLRGHQNPSAKCTQHKGSGQRFARSDVLFI